MIIIDTLEFSRDLEKAGMQKKVAETLAEKIKDAQLNSSQKLVTKSDIKSEIALLRQEIRNALLTTIISLGTIMALIEKFVN
ncbi:MAG: hypothetical protein V4694_01175 [Pseudomonadota bacterium]